jgi:multidrug transporter EmrE-like cation transporter
MPPLNPSGATIMAATFLFLAAHNLVRAFLADDAKERDRRIIWVAIFVLFYMEAFEVLADVLQQMEAP